MHNANTLHHISPLVNEGYVWYREGVHGETGALLTLPFPYSMSEQAPPRTGLVSNILAVAGFIILIAIVVWGAFHFLNIASSGFSSLLSRNSGNTIQITMSNRTVGSGQPLDVSWKYTPSALGGSFALMYQCRDGFQFRGINAAGVVSPIPCGSAYTIGDSSAKSVRLVPVLGGTAPADVPFSVIYTQGGTVGTSTAATGTTRAQGNATVTVTPQAGMPIATSTLPATGSAGSPQAGTAVKTVPVGKPDLAVRIIAIGTVDLYSGMFVNRMPSGPNDVMAVKFDIANVGAGPSGVWYFTAQLPTYPATPYISPAQNSLGRGDHIENTLRFNRALPQGGNFTVTVDPSNSISELSESNNYASQWIYGNSGYYPSPMQYEGNPYYPYQY